MFLPCLDLDQHFREVAVGCRPAHHGNIGRALEDLLAFLLRDAAQHAKLLSLSLQFLVVVEPVKDLLLGLVADRAGVIQDQSRLFDSRDLLVTFGNQRADDFFGIMHIHLAAERFDVEGLVGTHSHIGQV